MRPFYGIPLSENPPLSFRNRNFLGDIPLFDLIFSRRDVKRDETELVILVSPELVHPMEPCETPMILPGMEVTEPDDCAFFWLGYYEGVPDHHYRSTVWPLIGPSSGAARDAMFKRRVGYQDSEASYFYGAQGLSQ